MTSSTIRYSRLPGNHQSGEDSDGRSGLPGYLEQVVHATAPPADSPGAHRSDPRTHDPSIPDSDPRSPRYEPPRLRHRPGDTWIIDRTRPADPLDPGAYGAPGWYADTRTGRHRRDELPDPPDDAEPDTVSLDQVDRPGPEPEEATTERRERWNDQDRSPRKRRTVRGDEPNRSRPEPDIDDGQDHRFSAMRESAFERFMTYSADLHAAHLVPERPDWRERLAWAARWLTWVFAFGLVAMPRPLQAPTEPVPNCRKPSPGSMEFQGRAEVSVPQPQKAAPAADHWHTRPVQTRPSPGPIPYIAVWERAFDTGDFGFGGAA